MSPNFEFRKSTAATALSGGFVRNAVSFRVGNSAPSAAAISRAAYSMFSIEAVAFFLYFTRDALAGAARFYSYSFGVDAIWFVPDLVAVACMGVFVYRYAVLARNPLALFVSMYLCFSLVMGYFFLETFAGVASAFKMIGPLFVGFCFCDRYLGDYKRLLVWIHLLFYVTIVGIVVSSYVRFPWVGFAYESFGATRQAGRLWWTAAEPRLSGFAADSTMAGFFVMITYIITSCRKGIFWVLFWIGPAVYATKLSTSKTSMMVLVLYFICMIFVRILHDRYRFGLLRAIALLSFSAIGIPVILIALFSSIGEVGQKEFLFSMYDRTHNSWQKPFEYLYEHMPVSFIVGCGLGCFNYPQQIFSPTTAKYFVPVDNFYIGTYLMFGLPFVVFMFFVYRAAARMNDIYKLTTLFTVNVFTITVLSYGPASSLLLIGFAFSQVFSSNERNSAYSYRAIKKVNPSRRFRGPATLNEVRHVVPDLRPFSAPN